MTAPRQVAVIPGDGIGPEVMRATIRVIEGLEAPLTFEYCEAGAEAFKKYGTNLPRATIEAVMRTRVGLKGPTATGIGTGPASANVALRKELDLYANLRPVKSLPNLKTRYENVDLIVVRENTEDLYAGLEHIVVPGVVESLKIITERASLRIARFAFDLCAGLVGGLGVVPGGNFGERCAVFEAVHGSAPDIAGKGLANPTAIR